MNTEDFYTETSPYLWNSDSSQKDEGFFGKDDMKRFAEEYHQAKLKLLGIGGVSGCFTIGARIQITHCIHGHEYDVGQVVTIIDHEPSQTASWLCSDGKYSWWLSEEEGYVC